MNIYVLIAVISVTIAGFSQILLKKGAMREHVSFLDDYLNLPVISGYALMFATVLATMFAYRGVRYMTIQIIESLGYILVPVLSYFFFGEKFTENKVIGIAIILIGIAVYNI